MPIHCYSGRPGSGKSYSVVENVVLPTLREKRHIVTNMPLDLEALQNDFDTSLIHLLSMDRNQQDQLNLEHYEEYRGAVFIIDEAWRYWPSDARVSSFPEHVRSFFTEHRHFVGSDGRTTEIVLVCQSLQQLSPFIRELVDTTYITSKLDKVGRKGNYRVDIYSGPQSLTRANYLDLIRQAMGRYKKSVFKYYKSHTKNDTQFTAGTEEIVDKRNNVWNSPMLKFGLPIAVVVFLYGGYQLATFFRFIEPETHVENTVSLAPARPHQRDVPTRSFQVTNVDLPTQARVPLSEDWRIAAVAENSKGNGWIILEGADGDERTVPIRGNCQPVPLTKWEWSCFIDGELVTFYSGDRGGSSRTLL